MQFFFSPNASPCRPMSAGNKTQNDENLTKMRGIKRKISITAPLPRFGIRTAHHCRRPGNEYRAFYKHRIFQHGVDDLAVGQVFTGVSFLPRGFFRTHEFYRFTPRRDIMSSSSRREGGVLRYSTISGSMPFSRSNANALRHVEHFGL